MKTIKNQKGISLIIFMGLLVVLSFLFVISSNQYFSDIKIAKKNNTLENIELFQLSAISSLKKSQNRVERNYNNNEICEKIGCISNTENTIHFKRNFNCPPNETCYSIEILTVFENVGYAKKHYFK